MAQLIADRPPANSITIHSWAVMFGQTSLFARSIKISKSLETLMQFLIPVGFRVQHNLFYDYLCYILPFGLGSAIKAAEERCYLLI